MHVCPHDQAGLPLVLMPNSIRVGYNAQTDVKFETGYAIDTLQSAIVSHVPSQWLTPHAHPRVFFNFAFATHLSQMMDSINTHFTVHDVCATQRVFSIMR